MQNQQPRIEILERTILVGMNIETSLEENRTTSLWRSFMPRVKEIEHRSNKDFYSLQVYPESFTHGAFTRNTIFTKWAAVKVNETVPLPDGMETIHIPESKYAVFVHTGTSSAFPILANYIYTEWIPTSSYSIDNRPHFEIMGDKYLGHSDPKSEEEVWIPIK